MRTGKECHYLRVSEDNPITAPRRHKAVCARAESFQVFLPEDDALQPPFTLPPEASTSSSWRSNDHFQSSIDDALQMQPSNTGPHNWHLPRNSYVAEVPREQPFASKPVHGRPRLPHRSTDPIPHTRMRYDESSNDSRFSPSPYPSPMLHHMQHSQPPPQPLNLTYAATAPWPIYGPYATEASSSRESDCSSSLEGLPSVYDAHTLQQQQQQQHHASMWPTHTSPMALYTSQPFFPNDCPPPGESPHQFRASYSLNQMSSNREHASHQEHSMQHSSDYHPGPEYANEQYPNQY